MLMDEHCVHECLCEWIRKLRMEISLLNNLYYRCSGRPTPWSATESVYSRITVGAVKLTPTVARWLSGGTETGTDYRHSPARHGPSAHATAYRGRGGMGGCADTHAEAASRKFQKDS